VNNRSISFFETMSEETAIEPGGRGLAARVRPFHVMRILQRAQELEAAGRSILHLEIGEPDFPTPPQVVTAATRFLAAGRVRYTAAAGLSELRSRVADYYRARYNLSVSDRRIFVTPGASGALMLALAAILSPGQKVLFVDPGYPCYANFVRILSGDPVGVATGPEVDFQFTADLYRAHAGGHGAIALVASPSNPTGAILKPAAFRELVATVRSHGGVVIADEIYQGLEYGGSSPSALAYGEDLFVVNSFSKYFGMTGWRLGWLVVPDAFVEVVERLAQNLFIAASTLSQHAALAAFEADTLAELECRRATFEARRDYLCQELLRTGFAIPVQPAGAFYVYADCSALADDSAGFAADLLEREGVAVTPGMDFGDQEPERYVRFAYTVDLPVLREAMFRIRRMIGR
jgi:aspartate/methionine/tyrosine aminotransferase